MVSGAFPMDILHRPLRVTAKKIKQSSIHKLSGNPDNLVSQERKIFRRVFAVFAIPELYCQCMYFAGCTILSVVNKKLDI